MSRPGPLPPADVLAVLGSASANSEAKLALLEKRLTLSVSPGSSRDGIAPTDCNAHSASVASSQSLPGCVREPSAEATDPWQLGDLRAGERKRRRSLSGAVASSPARPARPSLSPFLVSATPIEVPPVVQPLDQAPIADGTPPSVKKPRNTISRYFAAIGDSSLDKRSLDAAPGDSNGGTQTGSLGEADRRSQQDADRQAANDAERRATEARSALAAAQEEVAEMRYACDVCAMRCLRGEGRGHGDPEAGESMSGVPEAGVCWPRRRWSRDIRRGRSRCRCHDRRRREGMSSHVPC